ncbi:MAG: A/G-specific adenine glycosylase [Opitutales bacterium]
MESLTDRLSEFRASLATWYADQHRHLPWRTRPSLYRTVVSEFMCQQTQIATVLPYFERWMQRFPDFQALADAPSEGVLKLWEGLGYYSRARNLQRLAQAYVTADTPPKTVEQWLKYPGVGPYTAAAIASIHFDQPQAVVDGNVVRVLARLTADGTHFRGGGQAVMHFKALAGAVLDVDQPGTHNQALMELGALVCLKHKPLCTVCPVVKMCAGAQSGEPERFPRIERAKTERITVDRLFLRRPEDGAILFERARSNSQRLAEIYQLPDARAVFPEGLPARSQLLATKQRGISNQRITERFFTIPEGSADCSPPADCAFLTPEEIAKATLSGPHRKWLPKLLEACLGRATVSHDGS